MTIERDQALAQSFTELFERSGRTQDELAEREGRSSDGTANDHRDGRPTLRERDHLLRRLIAVHGAPRFDLFTHGKVR